MSAPLAAEVLRLAPFAGGLVDDAIAGRLAWADLLKWATEWAEQQRRAHPTCRCGKPAMSWLCEVCRACLEKEQANGSDREAEIAPRHQEPAKAVRRGRRKG